jgi:hypothetical protein
VSFFCRDRFSLPVLAPKQLGLGFNQTCQRLRFAILTKENSPAPTQRYVCRHHPASVQRLQFNDVHVARVARPPSASLEVQVNSRTHVPQKLKCIDFAICTNPVSILSVPIQTVHKSP